MWKLVTISQLAGLSNENLRESHRQLFTSIAIQGWGERACVVKTVCNHQMDRWGNKEPYLEYFKVFDDLLDPLMPDFTLPFWQQLACLERERMIGYGHPPEPVEFYFKELQENEEMTNIIIDAHYHLPSVEGNWRVSPSIFNEPAFYIDLNIG